MKPKTAATTSPPQTSSLKNQDSATKRIQSIRNRASPEKNGKDIHSFSINTKNLLDATKIHQQFYSSRSSKALIGTQLKVRFLCFSSIQNFRKYL